MFKRSGSAVEEGEEVVVDKRPKLSLHIPSCIVDNKVKTYISTQRPISVYTVADLMEKRFNISRVASYCGAGGDWMGFSCLYNEVQMFVYVDTKRKCIWVTSDEADAFEQPNKHIQYSTLCIQLNTELNTYGTESAIESLQDPDIPNIPEEMTLTEGVDETVIASLGGTYRTIVRKVGDVVTFAELFQRFFGAFKLKISTDLAAVWTLYEFEPTDGGVTTKYLAAVFRDTVVFNHAMTAEFSTILQQFAGACALQTIVKA